MKITAQLTSKHTNCWQLKQVTLITVKDTNLLQDRWACSQSWVHWQSSWCPRSESEDAPPRPHQPRPEPRTVWWSPETSSDSFSPVISNISPQQSSKPCPATNSKKTQWSQPNIFHRVVGSELPRQASLVWRSVKRELLDKSQETWNVVVICNIINRLMSRSQYT